MKKLLALSLIGMGFMLAGCSDEPGDIKVDKNAPRKVIALTQAEEQVCQQSTLFGWKLLKEVKQNDEGNYNNQNQVVSPLSATLVLSMLADGANDQFRNEIYTTLGFNSCDKEAVNSYNKLLSSKLIDLDKSTILQLANSMWYKPDKIVINPEYTASIQDNYNVEAREFNSENGAELIRQWCRKKTHNLLDLDLNNEVAAYNFMLFNALYFKGDWTEPFKKSNSTRGTFTNESGNAVLVNMMYANLLSTNTYKADNMIAVELPFGNGTYSMTFILPAYGKTVEETLDAMIAENWTMDKVDTQREVFINLPSFDVSYSAVLTKALQNMGIASLTDPTNLPGISSSNIYSKDVVQTIKFAVTEEGAEVAAVTNTGLSTDPGPNDRELRVTFNRPFIYVLSECSTHTVLFSGVITKM